MQDSESVISSYVPLGRSVTLTNDEWLILSQCVEAFCNTYRDKHSVYVTTLLTRGQTEQAVNEASKMNDMLVRLDDIQMRLVC